MSERGGANATPNHFAALGLPEKADLDAEEIRERFHTLSREHHPDAQPGAERKSEAGGFTDINLAHQTLQSPARRLRHLLELRFGDAFQLRGTIDPELLDLFQTIQPALSRADAVITRRREAESAIARALLTNEVLEAQNALQDVLATVNRHSAQSIGEFAELDQALSTNPDSARDRATAVCRNLQYLEKWQGELQRRLHELW